jgi:AcrR family transcriptional regulator
MNTPARESLRARVKRDKLSRIEAAARRLFAEKGFEATTTRQLADEAGIGMGTLFVYFPEKLDLLIHLFNQDLAVVQERSFATLPSGAGLVDSCLHVFKAFYAVWERDPKLARSFVKEMMFTQGKGEGPLFETRTRVFGRLAALVAGAQARGELRSDLVPPVVAFQLFGIYYWCLSAWLANAPVDAATRDALTRSSLEQLVRGLQREVRS